jgi:hypothetical protein
MVFGNLYIEIIKYPILKAGGVSVYEIRSTSLILRMIFGRSSYAHLAFYSL